MSFLGTFFGTKTGPQYSVELFEIGDEDSVKFFEVFTVRSSYSIHDEVKQWVANNIVSWKEENPDWFKIGMIPDDFVPYAVVQEEGGAKRRRSSISIREIVGLAPTEPTNNNEQQILIPNSVVNRWTTLAEDLYSTKTNNHKANFTHLKKAFDNNIQLLNPLTTRCPDFRTILAFSLADRFGFRVKKIDQETTMSEWTMEDCRKVGNSLATFIRRHKTGALAIKAWRDRYQQLDILFREVEGERGEAS